MYMYIYIYIYLYIYIYVYIWLHIIYVCLYTCTGWLWLVGSIKLSVSFAKETYKRDAILQKRPIISSILLTVATPYTHIYSHRPLTCTYHIYPVHAHVYIFIYTHIYTYYAYRRSSELRCRPRPARMSCYA